MRVSAYARSLAIRPDGMNDPVPSGSYSKTAHNPCADVVQIFSNQEPMPATLTRILSSTSNVDLLPFASHIISGFYEPPGANINEALDPEASPAPRQAIYISCSFALPQVAHAGSNPRRTLVRIASGSKHYFSLMGAGLLHVQCPPDRAGRAHRRPCAYRERYSQR